MEYKEIQAKSILVTSKLPDADIVVNPYTGCEFGCLYCYASFMGRFVGQPIGSWGDYVFVKANAVALLESELAGWSADRRRATILLSSVTDPYQGAEKKYRLTRGILDVLAREQYPGLVSILTKSPMVTRDIDLFCALPRVEIGMTITTTDDKLSRFLEIRAPLASARLKTLRRLNESGLATYAFVGPLLPHFRYQAALLDELFSSIAEAGVCFVFVEHINLKQYIRERLWKTLQDQPAEIQNVYRDASTSEHREALGVMVAELMRKYGLNLRLNEVLYHNKGKNDDASMPTAPE